MSHDLTALADAASPQRRRRRLATSVFAAFAFVATAMPMNVQARSAPESFADLADEVTGAVVNISASTTVEAKSRTLPQLPPGTPFEDLFEEFFNRRGGQGGQGNNGDSAPQRQRRSNSL